MPDKPVRKRAKPVAAPKPPTPSHAPAAISDDAPRPSDALVTESVDIHALAARCPPSSLAEVREVIGDVGDDALIAAGREVDTARISAEGARVLAEAIRFFAAATAAERDAVDLTLATVHVAVWCCAQGAVAHRALRESRAARRAAVRGRTTQGKDALARAEAEAARLADTLKNVASGDEVTTERILYATRPRAERMADTGPGQRLTSLVAIGRELAARDAATRARAARWKVTGERLERCAALAEEALAAGRYDATPTLRDDARAQAEVDRWDGVNLRLLGAIVRAFAHGHAALASVPKLRVDALRHALNLYTKRAKKPAAEPAKPA